MGVSIEAAAGLEEEEVFVLLRVVSVGAFFDLVVVPFAFLSLFLEAVEVAVVVFLTVRLLLNVDLFSGLTTVKARNSDNALLLLVVVVLSFGLGAVCMLLLLL
jgi:hypothetical protein